MTIETAAPSVDLARRLERFRAAQADGGRPDGPLPHRPIGSAELAQRLAATLDGEVIDGAGGRFVRIERPAIAIEIDRIRLATLPGQPPAGRPLVCLDTETTGLATATGTVAFCLGLGWWEGTAFRQIQLLLPDHADEPAMLAELARHLPPDAWLVTYNGRTFDWPLLVTRYRMARRAAPAHDGHLDLLPIVRRVFRHRMVDARLRTVEEALLGMVRHDDVDGWEIPARYLGFLRGGPAHPLLAVVRHNHEDVRSLARLLALIEGVYATPETRRGAPSGDLAGLARAYLRARRLPEALACLDEVWVRSPEPVVAPPPVVAPESPATPAATRTVAAEDVPWWSPRARPDFGGRPRPVATRDGAWSPRAAFDRPWDDARIAVDRAHLLRRLGRIEDALAAWSALAAGPGRTALVARIEIAKLREHRLRDRSGALAAALDGLDAADRRRRLGWPEPALEADLARRIVRLRRRVARPVTTRMTSPR
jgi:RNase_H superfamily